jgi:hypothetical protein
LQHVDASRQVDASELAAAWPYARLAERGLVRARVLLARDSRRGTRRTGGTRSKQQQNGGFGCLRLRRTERRRRRRKQVVERKGSLEKGELGGERRVAHGGLRGSGLR